MMNKKSGVAPHIREMGTRWLEKSGLEDIGSGIIGLWLSSFNNAYIDRVPFMEAMEEYDNLLTFDLDEFTGHTNAKYVFSGTGPYLVREGDIAIGVTGVDGDELMWSIQFPDGTWSSPSSVLSQYFRIIGDIDVVKRWCKPQPIDALLGQGNCSAMPHLLHSIRLANCYIESSEVTDLMEMNLFRELADEMVVACKYGSKALTFVSAVTPMLENHDISEDYKLSRFPALYVFMSHLKSYM